MLRYRATLLYSLWCLLSAKSDFLVVRSRGTIRIKFQRQSSACQPTPLQTRLRRRRRRQDDQHRKQDSAGAGGMTHRRRNDAAGHRSYASRGHAAVEKVQAPCSVTPMREMRIPLLIRWQITLLDIGVSKCVPRDRSDPGVVKQPCDFIMRRKVSKIGNCGLT